MRRIAGVLLAISSLPSEQGIGDFGPHAYEFIDILKESKIKVWQILPLNPLGFGNSPYQPYSSKAMDELYISLDMLKQEGLLNEIKEFNKNSTVTMYQEVRAFKEEYLKEAYANFINRKDFKEFDQFVKDNSWVNEYALYVTFKKENDNQMWCYWREDMKNYIKDHKLDLTPYLDKINYEKWIQYVVFKQWAALHEYAIKMGIMIMGDVPFYVGLDSLDVWENQQDFLLQLDGTAAFVAGVPPDYFSKTGQRWGNPIYNWEQIQKENFFFWIDRLGFSSKIFDIIRIDHFRAFDTYWKIPESCPTAVEGEWKTAPGYALFDELYRAYPHINIVAEDLGDLFPSVLKLRDHYNLPGMNVLQFTFDYNKQEYGVKDINNQICYTGTHDNEMINGWVKTLKKPDYDKLVNKLARLGYHDSDIAKDFVNLAFDNRADFAIIPMQDFLSYDDSAKMNTPSTVGSPNWEWKLVSFDEFKKLVPWLKEKIVKCNRDN
jgi:4-alpha-glucanotransferase